MINKRLISTMVFNRFKYPRVIITVLIDESVVGIMKVLVEMVFIDVWVAVVIDTFAGV